MASESSGRVGVWFLGARGSVATTATVGVLAVRSGLMPGTGFVSELEEVAAAGLCSLDDLVLGGHDLTSDPLVKRAEALAGEGVLPAALVGVLRDQLDDVEHNLRPATQAGESQAQAIARLRADLDEFRTREQLDRVVVVDVTSTQPAVELDGPLAALAGLEAALAAGRDPLPPSAVGVYAAFLAGCPVVAFTPSPGPQLPALAELAQREKIPWAGCDGKTGQTLLKSALAPMFTTRALQVRSWSSMNLLGGGDGQTLADPAAAASKLASKAGPVTALLGPDVQGPMHIDYVADLGDWKTAWDHVSFEGFLGTRMTLQLTWQGCDSALAAPLVIDLARLLARAHERGQTGPQGWLAFFFKEPHGTGEHGLAEQWRALTDWCRHVA